MGQQPRCGAVPRTPGLTGCGARERRIGVSDRSGKHRRDRGEPGRQGRNGDRAKRKCAAPCRCPCLESPTRGELHGVQDRGVRSVRRRCSAASCAGVPRGVCLAGLMCAYRNPSPKSKLSNGALGHASERSVQKISKACRIWMQGQLLRGVTVGRGPGRVNGSAAVARPLTAKPPRDSGGFAGDASAHPMRTTRSTGTLQATNNVA
jgi:hypothetical protein